MLELIAMNAVLPSERERVIAFLDIGTNSIRLLLVRIRPNHSFQILTTQKETVRLGEGEFVDAYLQPAAIDRATLVCKKFAELSRSHGAEEIIAVATAATREAQNQDELVRRLRREAGLDVHVVSGMEEARLVYLGVASGVHMGDRQAVFIDIGGGSTEVVVGDQHQHYHLSSLKLGAVRLASIFFLPDETSPVSPERYALIKRYVLNASVRTLQQVRLHRLDMALGSSGTIENLMDIALRLFQNRARQRDDVVSHGDLKRVIERLCALPLEERRQMPGINPERADIIIAGAAIIDTLMDELELPELRVLGERGLREGLLVDYLARSENAEMMQEMSVRERNVWQLGRTCHFDETHSRHIAHLALELFDSAATADLHSLGVRERELLQYAALLHDIGAFISYSNHPAHTAYLIANADLLGFDQSEIAILAAIGLFHRKGKPSRKRVEYTGLNKRSRRIVKTLSAIMRIAESLDRSHSGVITHAGLRREKKKVVLEIEARQDCQLELWGLENHLPDIQESLDCTLEVRVIKQPEPEKPPLEIED